jgi:hypothetical protein
MNDKNLIASLDSATLIAKAVDGKTIRRVKFKLAREFSVEDAEWLGDDAISMREMLTEGALKKFEIPIDAYHAKAAFSGMAGNADADVDGVSAAITTKKGKGDDAEDTYELTIGFEAFPKDKLLTFLAASMGEHIEVELKRTQLENALKDGVTKAVDKFKKSSPKGTTMTFSTVIGGKREEGPTLEGTGER